MTKKKTIYVGQQLNILVFTLFFFSGAFALVYEVSWVRAITLEFGSTTLAISTVLAIFMGGLALGAWLIARWVDQFTNPLTKYGYIEISIAIYALLTPFIFRWVLPMFGTIGANFADNIWFLSILRFLATSILLLFPTILMGATLPLLSRFYANRKRDGARGGGLLYGVNTVGAFFGTLIAGFILLPKLGLFWTLIGVAGCNLIAGIIALVAGNRFETGETSTSISLSTKPLARIKTSPVDRFPVLIAIALTGFAAMACEVVWTRVLILLLGSSVYAFTIVLSTFLAGLGLGAAIVASFLRVDPSKALILFYSLAQSAAILILLTSAIFQYLPALFLNIFWSWDILQYPDKVFYAQVLIAAAVMFVPTLIMGGLFPAAARIVIHNPQNTGARIANLYTWNAIGSVFGSIVAGFIFIPLLGIRSALLVVMATYCFGAVVSVYGRKKKPRLSYAATGGVAILFIIFLLMPNWHEQLMTSAMYNYAYHLSKMETKQLASELRRRHQILYYRDGLTATITVTKSINSKDHPLGITVNGKYDGSTTRDMANQRLLAHLPLLFHPNPQKVCVIGMGTGCTAGSASLYPVEEVKIVEIESAMVEGAKFFNQDNHFVHESPKVDIRITDGRLFLRLHPRSFDVIISEPSNPWLAGSSDLFTIEFFKYAAKSLREDGMFCQWVQIYALSPANVRTIVRTFTQVFPYTYLISTRPNLDMLLLGAENPFNLDLEQAWQRMQIKEIREDLADPRVAIENIYDLAARIRMGPDELPALIGSGPVHTDDLPIIAYNAPKDLYRKTEDKNMDLIAKHAKGIAPYIHLTNLSTEEKIEFLKRIAFSYRKFLPGSREAEICERLAQELSNDSNL